MICGGGDLFFLMTAVTDDLWRQRAVFLVV
jgi:hypothetical protein